jgi:uncharacterized protein YqeY
MLLKRLKVAQLTARKSKNRTAANLLTTLLGELSQVRAEKDSEILPVIKKFVKNIDLTLSNIEGTNHDLMYEREVLRSYLPKELTGAELESYIKDNIDTNKGIGFVMGQLKKLPYTIDMKEASRLCREL